MEIYNEIRYYTSIINNFIYFIKVEIFYSENVTESLNNQTLNPTYILETNSSYYDLYVPILPNTFPRTIDGEQVIAIFLRNNSNTGYDRYVL